MNLKSKKTLSIAVVALSILLVLATAPITFAPPPANPIQVIFDILGSAPVGSEGNIWLDIDRIYSELLGRLTSTRANNLDNVAQIVSDSDAFHSNTNDDHETIFVHPTNEISTVTVTINSFGIDTGDVLNIYYFVNPAIGNRYAWKTLTSDVDIGGWTDTFAAWRVVIAVEGTGDRSVTINWACSAVCPP